MDDLSGRVAEIVEEAPKLAEEARDRLRVLLAGANPDQHEGEGGRDGS